LSSIQQDELHLNQATAQPHSKNPVDAATDIDSTILNASASILNEELIVAQATTQPHNATPIDMTKNNNASSRVLHDESLLDQVTMQLCNENPVNVMIDRNCNVLTIEYDLLIVMFVNINITIIIIVFFLNQLNVLSSTICYLPIFCLCSLFAFLHGHMTAILTSREWYASNT
jgi:hypothetical protein